ncbi:putative Alpha3-fucosyltransferase [Mesorhizobium metallidurans STM 2683]|uniref:Putative Alpha3-fucosyltransferase n=1 Tax=Mesorhizobium metallidurans STM 2683 TaxID=1297569 RepID=M5EJW4_9HYPH|nr:glycosyltransferase family 10 [Mesorhizobium metallidurans]CCV05044.1 putative Alpha3-fucosyltransferase [Mesorhizobium metallidurans STM 2683]
MPSKDPLILFYTTFFGKPVDIASIRCDLPGQWTLDKRRIAEAATVVFHIPNFREIGDAWKYPGQFWIAWSMESRSNYKRIADPKIMRHFDFTMTHERGSDIWAPYLPRASWWEEVRATPIVAKTEAAPAVLFQSARLNYSGRVDFVQELSHHIKIDSYGRHFRNRTIEGPDLGKKTKLDTVAHYKFCLALENSSETDYVTEKLFDALKAGSVPVYLGAPNVGEFAPEGSYINAADFGSPAELAAYLRHLIPTPDAYEAYFGWRPKPLPDGLAARLQELEAPAFCRLMTFVRQQLEDYPNRPAGRLRLPFGPRSYVGTRLRRWNKKVPS